MQVASGDAGRWTALREVDIEPETAGIATRFAVESSRAYGGRLVLKLRRVDDAQAARRLRGGTVWAPAGQVPELPRGVYYQERLVGLEVHDAELGPLGRVADVLETGGVDVLVVDGGAEGEVLVPLAREIVRRIDEDAGAIEVRLPPGLRDVNREEPSR